MVLSELVEEVRGHSGQLLNYEAVFHISEINDSQRSVFHYDQVTTVKIIMDQPFLQLRKINILKRVSEIIGNILKQLPVWHTL